MERQNRERPVPGFATLVGGPVSVDYDLEAGLTIDTDGTREYVLEVMHTPGHSAGSVALFMPGDGALFSGDVIPVAGDLPVYDDAVASVHSIRLLRSVRSIRILLSAWDEPRYGDAAYGQMDQALAYLQKIHKAVIASAGNGNPDSLELTKKVVAAFGLPPQAVNPLLTRTFAANLRARDKDVLADSRQ